MQLRLKPDDIIISNIYGLMGKFSWSWEDILRIPIPTWNEILKQTEREYTESKRQQQKMKRK